MGQCKDCELYNEKSNWQQRMLDEYEQVCDRYEKLGKWMDSDMTKVLAEIGEYSTAPYEYYAFLCVQRGAMKRYIHALNKQMELWDKNEK